ncbi:hypothetical protein N7520_008579 [Penicillium odoratum]|uniref:uncharacterized protein n=1 Tax=Penicillium odoratum TaxID=1167516 RepID=UPI002549355F|nr:uncharacterized protein N7520_008579 [Penicillium odoratum]KAJ5751662.1 hypothetical protein N7520_008579 [Penicillium odoratum]
MHSGFDQEPVPNGEYEYACTTTFSGVSVFNILQEFIQPSSGTSLDFLVWGILGVVPDATLSTEVYVVGEIILEIAGPIPNYYPS